MGSKHGVSPGEAPIPNVVGISVLCMLALLPDPSSLLSDHVDAALRESAKGKDTVREMGPSYFFHTIKRRRDACYHSSATVQSVSPLYLI